MPLPVIVLAEGVEIAQRLAARAAASICIDGGGDDPRGEQPVEAHAGAAQHPRAHEVKPGEGGQRDEQDDRQHHQRDDAAARHHAVVDLQHVERRGEVEQVYGEAEQRGGARNSHGRAAIQRLRRLSTLSI